MINDARGKNLSERALTFKPPLTWTPVSAKSVSVIGTAVTNPPSVSREAKPAAAMAAMALNTYMLEVSSTLMLNE